MTDIFTFMKICRNVMSNYSLTWPNNSGPNNPTNSYIGKTKELPFELTINQHPQSLKMKEKFAWIVFQKHSHPATCFIQNMQVTKQFKNKCYIPRLKKNKTDKLSCLHRQDNSVPDPTVTEPTPTTIDQRTHLKDVGIERGNTCVVSIILKEAYMCLCRCQTHVP